MSIGPTGKTEEQTIEHEDKELKVVNVRDIDEPSRDEKLHPFEKEREESDTGEVSDDGEAKDNHSWDQFRASVGTQPHNPPVVVPDGESYRLVTGDRRLRAVKENYEGQEVSRKEQTILVQVDHTLETEGEVIRERIAENEFRKGNDKKARARNLAQLCAPWLLEPGERKGLKTMSQTQLGREIGHKQGVISAWLEPMRTEHPIRDALANTTPNNKPSDEQIETIDDLLQSVRTVVGPTQESFFGRQLKSMAEGSHGVSLAEVKTAIEIATEDGWNTQRLLQYIKDNYTSNVEENEEAEMEKVENEEGVEVDDLSGAGFEDDSKTKSNDSVDVSVKDDATEDNPSIEDIAISIQDKQWEELVDESELDQSFSSYQQKKMVGEAIEDEAAMLVHVLADHYNTSTRQVLRKFVEPLIIDHGTAVLREEL